MTPGEILDAVAGELSGYRFSYGNEHDLQVAVAHVLSDRWDVIYERKLLLGGRVDLYLPDVRVGIECKIEGSPTDTARQCARYLTSPEVDALLLVTRRARILIPTDTCDKPFKVVSLARAAL